MAALALSLTLAWGARALAAQSADPSLPDLAVRLASMTAVTGYEQAMIDSLVALVPGSARDRAGNAVLVLGSGDRRRLVACPVSEPGFVVGQVRDDGWLTLRRTPGRPSPWSSGRSKASGSPCSDGEGPCRESWGCDPFTSPAGEASPPRAASP